MSAANLQLEAKRTPRFGGVFWRMARRTAPLMSRFAGGSWNPLFAIVEHTGRRSGRRYEAPVAARRGSDGFVISLAFGAQSDWYRNLLASDGGVIRWRDRRYPVGAPERIEASAAMPEFHPIQQLAMRLTRIRGFVRVPDAPALP